MQRNVLSLVGIYLCSQTFCDPWKFAHVAECIDILALLSIWARRIFLDAISSWNQHKRGVQPPRLFPRKCSFSLCSLRTTIALVALLQLKLLVSTVLMLQRLQLIRLPVFLFVGVN
jgi:hypothetical protein